MKTIISLKIILLILFCSLNSRAQTVSTIASGLGLPTGVAVDSVGNVYVTDRMIKVIKKITPAGVVTTISTNYSLPNGLAVDNTGWIFIADSKHLDKLFQFGTSTAFAGPGNNGNPMAVECIDGNGAVARFGEVVGIVRDASGNFLVADASCNKIRKVTPAGVVTTFAGSGSVGAANGTGVAASFNQPQGIAIDGQGNLFVADANNHLIRKITPAGVVTTLAGVGTAGFVNGPAATAKFFRPTGVAVDTQGNIFVADSLNHSIRKITSSGTVSTYAGGASTGFCFDGPALSGAMFHTPYGIAIDSGGNLFVADYGCGKVRKITKPGRVLTRATEAINPGILSAAAACTCGGWNSKKVTLNGVVKDLECGGGLTIEQNKSANFNLSYTCSGTCSTKYEAVITKPDGTTQTVLITNNANWPYTFSMLGNYTINFKTSCDAAACSDSCNYTVTVK